MVKHSGLFGNMCRESLWAEHFISEQLPFVVADFMDIK